MVEVTNEVITLLRGQLQKLGSNVDIAVNGQVAVEKMKLTPRPNYDIILLDLEMPVKGKLNGAVVLTSDILI